jgi:hypothetical protein
LEVAGYEFDFHVSVNRRLDFKNGPFLVSIAAILVRTDMSSFASQQVPGIAMELSAVDCGTAVNNFLKS